MATRKRTPSKEPSAQEASDTYSADDIVTLKGLEAVRLRPGMYVGGTDARSLHHIIWEIVDNAVDEHLAGYGQDIHVHVDADSVVTVRDHGRGIPPQVNADGQSALSAVFLNLHAGAKFGKTEGGYTISGGLHGVGSAVTNALSEWMEVEVYRDGHVWTTRYARGEETQEVKRGRRLRAGEDHGTLVRFRFDETVFNKGVAYAQHEIETRLWQKAYLIAGLRFHFTWHGEETQLITSRKGLTEYVGNLSEEREPLHAPVHFPDEEVRIADGAGREVGISVEVAVQWTRKGGSVDGNVLGFANIITTPQGGTHVTGLKASVTKALNNYAIEQRKFKVERKADRFDSRDVFAACTGIVSVKLPDPQFEGQTKEKLNNTEARTAVNQVVFRAFTEWLADKRNAKDAKEILERCLHSRRVRLAESSVKSYNPNSILADNGQSEKLSDCSQNTPFAERELFLVEGDSAGGTAVNARDNRFQAILPLRGKMINALSNTNAKVFENEEVQSLIMALGGRIEQFEGERIVVLPRDKRRYGKVMLCSDADQDGAHINNLALVLFHELFPELLREGRVFLTKPPLFRLLLDKRGERAVLAYSDEERDAASAKHKPVAIQRFKGLGEMNADQLQETVMDPATRRIQQVTVEDAAEVIEALQLVMGGSSARLVERRRAWISRVSRDADIDV